MLRLEHSSSKKLLSGQFTQSISRNKPKLKDLNACDKSQVNTKDDSVVRKGSKFLL